jgi:hypothetical protein
MNNENIQSIIYKCYHVVSLCNDCIKKLQKPYKCLICRKDSKMLCNFFISIINVKKLK